MNDSTGNARLEEERFHDLIHSVNSDGLQSMAWPGRRKKEPGKSENGKADGTVKAHKPLGNDIKPEEKVPREPPKDKVYAVSHEAKTEKHPKKDNPQKTVGRKPKEKVKKDTVPNAITIEGEWGDFKVRLTGYNSRDSNAKRWVILLPEKIHDIIQVVFNRDSSAAISVILQSFIDRNRDNMRDLITEKSTLF